MTTNKEKQTIVNTAQSAVEEKRIIRKLSLVSIFGNTILSGFKMIAGIFGHSGAMISDAIHSFSDVLTTVIAYFGVKFSKKEADKAHPYGHERFECVASLILGLMLLLTGVGVGIAGMKNILQGHYETLAIPGAIALIAAVISIFGKEGMYWYTRYYAKKINSTAFMADAWHHRSDAFSSVGSLIGIGGAMLGFPVLDSMASVVICLFILKVSYDILKDAISKMLDTACDEIFEDQLRQFIENQPDVMHVDMLHTRMFGNKIYMDLEIEVDGDKPLWESHAVAEQVHDRVEAAFPDIKHIMIHVNPAEFAVDKG
ncbi:cation diffusion facilitator family transporter [Beduini massiliensis]|uniref:cation diffusion facilitator family transporter n=1 Tax=Beduini massiliensis TaxID=1585974 RepID=UPI00059AA7A8|nr:cation diffusion facilitator family transporter [Beduini massiliensis]